VNQLKLIAYPKQRFRVPEHQISVVVQAGMKVPDDALF
jgi:hypothetical protein